MSPGFLLTIILIALLLLLLVGGVFWFLRRRAAGRETTQPARTAKKRSPEKQPPVPASSPETAPAQATGPAAQKEAAASPGTASQTRSSPEGSARIKILIVDDNPDTRGHVTRLLYFEDNLDVIGQAVNGRQGVEMAIELKPHIVLMDINMPDMDGITATREIRLKAPFSQVIIMSVQAEQHYLKQAMAAGARDFQPKPFTAEELISCVRRVYNIGLPSYEQYAAMEQTEARQRSDESDGQVAKSEGTPVIAIYSPKGGIGTSTIAANVAVALQRAYGDIVLMDADLQFGDILVHLNTRPSRTMSDIIHDGALDLELLADVLLPHHSGLKLLLSPPQPELADAVTPEMVGQMVEGVTQFARAVVVDTPSKIDDKTLAILERADYILIVSAPELPAVKSTKLFLELAKALEFKADRLGVIINRSDQPGGVSLAKIEEILKLDRTFRVPYDPRLVLAINRGVVLTQQEPNGPAARAIIQLSQEVGEGLITPPEMELVGEDTA